MNTEGSQLLREIRDEVDAAEKAAIIARDMIAAKLDETTKLQIALLTQIRDELALINDALHDDQQREWLQRIRKKLVDIFNKP